MEFIDERRKDIPTEVIVQKTEDIPYFYLHDQIQEILDSEEYKETSQILIGLSVIMQCILLFNTLSSNGWKSLLL